MKKLYLFFVLFLFGLVQADTPRSCLSTDWAPTWGVFSVSKPSISSAVTTQYFSWSSTRLTALKAKGLVGNYYQYEVRRNSEYWDYMRPPRCIGSYVTILPYPTAAYSEEADGGCLTPDEEFQINSPSRYINSGTWYYARAYFLRDSLDVNRVMHIHSESEWCAPRYAACFAGFEWCTMSSMDVGA